MGTDFDSLFEDIGGFGPVQRRIFILISMMEAPAAWVMFLPVFIHAVPTQWSCQSTEGNGSTWSNDSTTASNFTTASNLSTVILDKCGAPVNAPSMCLPTGDVCPNLNFSGSPFTSIVTEWDLVCLLSYVPTMIVTLQMAGLLVGAALFGQLADMYGRKPTMFTAYALMCVVGVVAAYAPSWQVYAAARAFLGVFFGGTLVINQVMPLEFVGRKWRTFCGCIGFWAVGIMQLAGLAYLIRDWRYLSLTTALLSLPLLITWWFIPESPRWLIQKGRITEAEKIIRHIAAGSERDAPDSSKLMLITQSDEEKSKRSKKYSFWDLCINFEMTRNSTILVYTWFVCAFVYYGVSLNVSALSGDRYINVFLLGFVDLPALAFVIIINNTLGRRWTLGILMSLAGTSCFILLILDISGVLCSLATLTQVLAMLGKSGIAGSWAAAQVFSAELFPTVVRNIGVGACSMAARVGGVLAPQVILLNDISKPLPYIIFGSLALLCAGLTYFLPETLNTPLPDTLPQRTFCVSCCHRSDEAASSPVLVSLSPVTHQQTVNPEDRPEDLLTEAL